MITDTTGATERGAAEQHTAAGTTCEINVTALITEFSGTRERKPILLTSCTRPLYQHWLARHVERCSGARQSHQFDHLDWHERTGTHQQRATNNSV